LLVWSRWLRPPRRRSCGWLGTRCAGGTAHDSYPAFQRMAAELQARIGFLLAAISAAPARATTQEER
jgi:hypothetical protein